MDQFTAHLDRGWDLAQRGDASGAESSARRALELENDSPEAHNLLGYSCALRGDHEEALEFYQQAIALDDTFLEAILNAAELCVHPLADPEAALSFCDSALDLVENDEELTDTLLLKFDAYFGMSELDDARAVLGRIPTPPYQNPAHFFLVGRALFETGDLEQAERLLKEAVRKEPENPEAQYYLAMLCDNRGDGREATEHLLRSLGLDRALPHVPWGLSQEAFRTTARQALEKINPRLRAFVDESEIYFADLPGVEIVVEGADPRTPVLLDALEGEHPALRIFIYQRNIERMSGGVERIPETLVASLEREIATIVFGEIEAPTPDAGTLN